jgi:hypothetical protein
VAGLGVVARAALFVGSLALAGVAHAAPAYGYSRDDLRDELRLLWSERATWSRGLVVSTTSGLADAPVARAKLDGNAVELARVVGAYDGSVSADELARALELETRGVEGLVAALKDGMPATIEAARDEAYARADDVAAILGGGDADSTDVSSSMNGYAEATLSEVRARLRGDWDADIAAYDRAIDRALELADTSAADAAARAPDAFAPPRRTAEEEALHVAMRELWMDHATWARFVIVDQVAGLPETPRTTIRLLANQRQLGDELRPTYGDAAGDGWTNLLREHVFVGAAVVDAAASHDADRLRTARTVWYTNAYTMDTFLAAANPAWSTPLVPDLVKTHLDQTSIEAMSRVLDDWAGDAAAYDAVVANALELADTMSAGLVARGLPGPG